VEHSPVAPSRQQLCCAERFSVRSSRLDDEDTLRRKLGRVRLGLRRGNRRRSMMARSELIRYSATRGATSYTSPTRNRDRSNAAVRIAGAVISTLTGRSRRSLKNPIKGGALYISGLQLIYSIARR